MYGKYFFMAVLHLSSVHLCRQASKTTDLTTAVKFPLNSLITIFKFYDETQKGFPADTDNYPSLNHNNDTHK